LGIISFAARRGPVHSLVSPARPGPLDYFISGPGPALGPPGRSDQQFKI